MNLPSLTKLLTETKNTFLKFPFSITGGIIIAIASIIMNENFDLPAVINDDILRNIILTLIFVIPLLTGIQLRSDRHHWQRNKTILSKLTILVLGVGFYWYLLPAPQENWLDSNLILTTVLIGNSFLFLSFAPFFYDREDQFWWKYLRSYLINILITAGIGIALWLGLIAIIFSANTLFEMSLNEDLYFDIWIIVTAVFGPWMFLSRFSNDTNNLDKNTQPRKLEKSFGQYILVPLLTVYTVILYLYTAKIIISNEWPQGIISALIIGYAIVGIITHIQLFPFQKEKNNKWISKTTKWFYILLLPLMYMLFKAIYLRISDYGITENRYYVVLMGFWLIATALYFIFSTKKNIKYIPVSIFIITIFSLIGPWSSLDISKTSQTKRFEALISDGLDVSQENKEELRSIVEYLARTHGLRDVTRHFAAQLPEDFNMLDSWQQTDIIMDQINENNVETEIQPSLVSTYHFNSWEPGVLNIEGFDYSMHIEEGIFDIRDVAYSINFDHSTKIGINIVKNGSQYLFVDMDEFMRDLYKNRSTAYDMPPEKLTYEYEDQEIKLRFIFEKITLVSTEETEELKLENARGKLLLKFKQ